MSSAAHRSWIQLSLIGTAALWGGTFVMVKGAVADYALYSFLGWRFAISVIAFGLIFPRSFRRLDRGSVQAGLLAGVFLCAGYIFQTWGLESTTASKAAFITGMFVVVTPLLQALILRHVPAWPTILGAIVAVVGLWMLSGTSAGGWNIGDTRVFGCAVAYSAHMIVLGGIGKRHDHLAVTLVQLALCAVVCGGVALIIEPRVLPGSLEVWVALLVTGVLATAVAFAIQTYAQRHISPARTALILISEPAFGGLFGWLAGESIGVTGIAGAALILAGMAAAELVGIRAEPGERVVLEPSLEGPAAPLVESD